MDKLREYLNGRLQRLDEEMTGYPSDKSPAHFNFRRGERAAVLEFQVVLNKISPEGNGLEQKLRELVDAQEKYIDRQAALINKQAAFIDSLLKGGK